MTTFNLIFMDFKPQMFVVFLPIVRTFQIVPITAINRIVPRWSKNSLKFKKNILKTGLKQSKRDNIKKNVHKTVVLQFSSWKKVIFHINHIKVSSYHCHLDKPSFYREGHLIYNYISFNSVKTYCVLCSFRRNFKFTNTLCEFVFYVILTILDNSLNNFV